MNKQAGVFESGERVRIPQEFQYESHLWSRSNQWLRRLLQFVFGVDPQLPDDVVQEYAASYFDADPVAEAFVDEVYLQHGQAHGRALLDKALEQGVDAVLEAPQSMRTMFAEMEEEPSWLDWQQVELGARVFRRFGTHMYSFAGAITLHGYRENSVAKPLAMTGAYAGDTANRRFLETARFWIDVSEPGALRPGGMGRKTALKVRIMHVFVRRRLLQHPAWDLDAWGVPISQGDALLTLMGGSFIPGYGLRALGYQTTTEEIEAMMHFWRYVGHLMGVQPRWYPANVHEALGLMFTSHVKGIGGSGEDGKMLAHSYVESYAPQRDSGGIEAFQRACEYRMQLGYVSLFVPPKTHRLYDLPAPGLWRLAPVAQVPWIAVRELLRRHSSAFDDWFDRRQRRRTAGWVQARLGKRRAEYRAVETFTR
jgi:hypothetical protein